MLGSLVRKTIILFVGLSLIVFGIIIIPLPGPGILIILVGLWLWGQEFEWARRMQRALWQKVRDRFQRNRRPDPSREVHVDPPRRDR